MERKKNEVGRSKRTEVGKGKKREVRSKKRKLQNYNPRHEK